MTTMTVDIDNTISSITPQGIDNGVALSRDDVTISLSDKPEKSNNDGHQPRRRKPSSWQLFVKSTKHLVSNIFKCSSVTISCFFAILVRLLFTAYR